MKKVVLLTVLAIVLSATTALAATWQQIYTDQQDNVIFFDTDSVKVSSMNANSDFTFSAVYRMNYSDKGRAALIDWYRNYSIVPAGIEGLSYDISTVQFKKEGDKRFYYIADRVSYTASGAAIPNMHYTSTTPNWQEIPTGSVVDVEYFEAALIVQGKLYKRVDSKDI